MSNYGITGWSGGPRQSLTHNLKAGQFRGMGRTNIFPSTTVVNNNFFGNGYGIYDDCCCNNNNSTPSWMNWMMGIGLGTSLLGNILGMFGIGGGGGGVSDTEGGGGSEKSSKTTKETTTEVSKQEQARKTLDSLGLTKKAGYEVLADEEGNLTYKYTDPDDPTNKKEAKNLAELLGLDKSIKAKKTAQPATTTTAKDTTAKETLPNLFNATGMAGLKTEAEVLEKFKTSTGSVAYKINSEGGAITITTVSDKGNNTSMTGSVTLSKEQLASLNKNGAKIQLTQFKNKDAYAENVDGYLRVTVGSQTYIVGKASDNTYQGYQFENGNVTGYNEANWIAPPPTKRHK